MAINYTYPIKAVPTVSDNVLIIDNEDTTNPRSTKTATIQSIVNLASGGGGGGGVTDFTSTAGTFVNVTTNAAATGSVSIGTVDLSATGTAGATTFLRGDNTWSTTGDVTGPASSVDLSIPVFDGTSGKIIKDGTGVTIDANGNVILDNWPNTAAEFRGDVDGAIRFTAQADENLSFGDVVYISGASGANTLVRKAQSDSASTMPAFGFVFKTTTLGNPVEVVTFGNLYGSGTKPLNTNSTTIGDILYVSSSIAGGWTNVRPTGATELVQNIGTVTRAHTTNGVIKAGGAGRVNGTPNTIDITGDITSDGDVEGATITKTGGTSSQFLKADGTVDSGTYLLNVVEDTTPQLGGNLDANTNNVTGAGKFQGDQFQSILNALAASAAVTFNTLNGVYAELTIDQNCTLDITNLGVGTPAILKVTQDASAPYTISSYTVGGGPAVVKWPSGAVPTITATLSAVDIITFISDGTNIYGSIVQDFS